MGARPRLDFISPKLVSRHHKWWLSWKGGMLRPGTSTFDNLPSQQANNIKMTSYQRRCDVITSHRRWYNVILTLCAHWDSRLRIACRYIFNLWQLHHRVDSLAQWLKHLSGKTRFESHNRRKKFSYASFFCNDFHVVRLPLQSFITTIYRPMIMANWETLFKYFIWSDCLTNMDSETSIQYIIVKDNG